MSEIDWQELKNIAIKIMAKAYAPYSNYPVGVAALTDSGVYVSGCNVENASAGLGLCAECVMIGELVKNGAGRLKAFVAVNGNSEVIVPCGRCRQLLYEHGGKELQIMMPTGIMTLDVVLPYAFGQADLGAVAGSFGDNFADKDKE